MLVIKIDRLHAQPAQTRLARTADVIRFSIHAPHPGIRPVADDAEFCGQENIAPFAFDRAPNQFFVRMRPVYVGGIQKVDAEFERQMNRRDRFVVVASAVKLRHPHAAKALHRNLGSSAP
jgi:hypothetical protein